MRGTAARQRASFRGRSFAALAVVTAIAVVLTLALAGTADAKKGAKSKKAAATTTTLATLKIQTAAVTVKAAGATKYVKAKDGQVLRQGDALRTDTAGKAEINYTDGSLTRLGSATDFQITKLTNKRGGRQTQGSLTVGDAWNRAAKVSETGSFEVKAGGVTAAVEGTAFLVSCRKPPGLPVACTVTAVVDDVSVTPVAGASTLLTPATSVGVNAGTPGSVSTLTYEELVQNTFIVDNINLDEQQGKGKGASVELPPPTTTTTTRPRVIVRPTEPEQPPETVPETTTTTTTTTAPPPTTTIQCNQNAGCNP